MGDYGFEGAGEFGGREENFNCLPDNYYTKCPNRLQGKKKRDFICLLTAQKAKGSRVIKYDGCDFCGHSYEECPTFVSHQGLEKKVAN